MTQLIDKYLCSYNQSKHQATSTDINNRTYNNTQKNAVYDTKINKNDLKNS